MEYWRAPGALFEDLGLTPAQQEKVDAIWADARTQSAAGGDRRAIWRAAWEKAQAVLTPEQVEKVRRRREEYRKLRAQRRGG